MPNFKKTFITPEEFERLESNHLSGPNGWLLFVACNSGMDLSQRVKEEYEKKLIGNNSRLKDIPLLYEDEYGQKITTIFDDTETRPRLSKHVAGSNAFIFQSALDRLNTSSVNENLMQLFQVVRTAKVHGAKHITAVMPYSVYGRQDKPTFQKREATTAKLNADLLITAGIDDALFYHLHTNSIKGFYEPHRVIALDGLDLFIELFGRFKGKKDVMTFSTDAGGAKFTIHYAETTSVDYGIASKYRPKDQKSDILGIIGQTEGKNVAIITDDETVTTGSILNVVSSLYTKHNIKEIYVAVSHNKINRGIIPKLIEAHEKYNLKELHVTDSIPQVEEVLDIPFIVVHPLAERIACTINRLHYNHSVSEIFCRRE